MSRIPPLDPSKLDTNFRTMLAEAEANGRSTTLPRVIGHCAELFRSYFRFYYTHHEAGLVETRTKELARLKIARLNDCPT